MTNFSGENLNAARGGPQGGGMESRRNGVAEVSPKYLAETASVAIPAGYKQTEVGVIPEDWEAVQLKQLFSLKNGYSFKGEFFSNKGPIVLTPGNFKLEGGLYFEYRNTKRYEANYPKGYEFNKGDLVVVMTDLTPDCNLLGKPAFIEVEELILHNQRIGKITQLVKGWEIRFLFYTLLSPTYLSTIKNAATGSTVRHTSPGTIASTWVAEPPKPEQTAIANVLSDVDALISELEKLITKKQAIKTATMQQLLTGRTRLPQFALRDDGSPKGTKPSELGEIPEDWEVYRFEQNFTIYAGGDVPKDSFSKIKTDSYPYPIFANAIQGRGLYGYTGYKRSKPDSVTITARGYLGHAEYRDEPFFPIVRLLVMEPLGTVDSKFTTYAINELVEFPTESTGVPQLTAPQVGKFSISAPADLKEQTAIATILSDMDAEIQALEQRLGKTRQVKQGMMQELLTGKTRLVSAQEP